MNTKIFSLNHYFLTTYLVVLGLLWPNLRHVVYADTRTVLFTGMTFLTYGLIYLLPAIIVTKLLEFLLHIPIAADARWARILVHVVAVITGGTTTLVVYADGFIYGIFGFHLNGFVWNLATTRGGIESMGTSSASIESFALIIGGLILLQVGLLGMALKRTWWGWWPKRGYALLLAAFLLLALTERGLYGVSEIQAHTPVLLASRAFPFYKPTTLHTLARQFGMDISSRKKFNFDISKAGLNYPQAPLVIAKPAKPLNIVWLVSESLRADMLDPEIMPSLWNFAGQAHRFNHHYSGGNGTRMAMFSMFYGLHGPYWFPFKGLQKSPVIMDVLQQQNYQFALYTSQSFSYPELNQTVFARMPEAVMHEQSQGFGWERDRKNVDDLITSLKRRDCDRPFMTFMFFESPHANYYFPEESIIRRPFLKEFNYATTAIADDIDLIKNRYVNSVHYDDQQIGRVIEALREEDLLKDTIVIVTGDHGEEFMEKGHWGHNSAFSEEQTRVPMVLWIPGTGSSVVNHLTSHLDIPATLLPLLGVKNPAADYSFGVSLLGQKGRDSAVISDWNRVALVSGNCKYILPMNAEGGLFAETLGKNDLPVLAGLDTNGQALQRETISLMKDLRRFL